MSTRQGEETSGLKAIL